MKCKLGLLALALALTIPASASAEPPFWKVDQTYSPFSTWSLNAAQYFAGEHYFPEILTWPPTAPGCPLRNLTAATGFKVYVVPYIGPIGASTGYGGYAPPGTCEIWIGLGTWNRAVGYESRRGGKWLRNTDLCPMIVHEASHHFLRDGTHNHTPDLDNREVKRVLCGGKRRIRGWNRVYHNSYNRHG